MRDKYKRELAKRRKIKAQLIEKCPIDGSGRKLCPKCMLLPDFRGLHLVHLKPLAQGGRTSMANCRVFCGRCHGKIHHTEGQPKSKPVDRPPMPCLNVPGLHAYPTWMQTGNKPEKGEELKCH